MATFAFRSPCGVDKIWIGPDRITDLIRSNLDFVDAALLEGTIDDFIDEQENRNTRAKTDRDVNLLKTSLQRKIELRNVEEMPPFFFFRFYKLYISLFPRASMDTSLAAEWVTLVESHLLTYSMKCSAISLSVSESKMEMTTRDDSWL